MLDKVEGIAAGNIHLPNRMPFTRLIKSGRASGSPYPLHAELKIVLAGINQRSINEQKEKGTISIELCPEYGDLRPPTVDDPRRWHLDRTELPSAPPSFQSGLKLAATELEQVGRASALGP